MFNAYFKTFEAHIFYYRVFKSRTLFIRLKKNSFIDNLYIYDTIYSCVRKVLWVFFELDFRFKFQLFGRKLKIILMEYLPRQLQYYKSYK